MVQLAAFSELFGRAPDFVDGHQHAQLFPQVRDAFLRAVKEAAPDAWVRQGGRNQPLAQRLGAPKALVLDILSAQFRKPRRARRHRLQSRLSPAPMIFRRQPDFGALMRQFLDGLPEGGLVMCHPGFVDDTLVSLDPLTDPARTRTRLSRRRAISRRCWRRIKLHWPDIARKACRSFCRIPKFNSGRATTCDTKPALHLPRASTHSTRGRTP